MVFLTQFPTAIRTRPLFLPCETIGHILTIMGSFWTMPERLSFFPCLLFVLLLSPIFFLARRALFWNRTKRINSWRRRRQKTGKSWDTILLLPVGIPQRQNRIITWCCFSPRSMFFLIPAPRISHFWITDPTLWYFPTPPHLRGDDPTLL